MRTQLFAGILTVLFVSSCASRYSRFGMMTHQRPDATEGSFLVAPIEKEVGLVSTNGKLLRTWTFDQRVYNASLLRNGNLGAITISILGDKFVRPFGHFEIRNDKNELVWQFTHPDIHHDFEELDNVRKQHPPLVA